MEIESFCCESSLRLIVHLICILEFHLNITSMLWWLACARL